ncbi:tRNA uridine-5-carboxymethylaminomethyl(34) synthesis GTPase MnmE [Paracoccus sanguinis]|uniref:tRNA uridine-5-carboxymethylaminomethyl(34) synthesis GTPase MnmE n=1 Tax=Paracoccus sanguinis TaxID=1545044 RepID=UPI00051FB7B8|nr:tRNA uridine-5-carboxymethylaminomethyl(34) synthesis GTPase MnmE [Paracoccus sanguinis]KGJ15063.1 tRNA modification GTPase TrmE [Paracoccus sanguinis]
METIYAEATPPGRGGVSIVRLSGPRAREIGEALAGPLPRARVAYRRAVRDEGLIDEALVLRFDAGASFTGDEVVEFQLHGAPVIVRRLQAALSARGARLAEAGEFTRRSFLNGTMALSGVEALSDLLAAETEAQRVQAMRVVSGELAAWTAALREKLIRAGALIEASLDFADEEVPEDVPPEVFELLAEVRAQIGRQILGVPAAERIRAGFEVAIIGPPNAGKSSLMNRIAGREVALVSDEAGTTRDVLELRTELGGLAVTFLDTAGLREAEDKVERMGVARARDRAAGADLRVILLGESLADEPLRVPGDIVVRSKADLGSGDISAVTGAGVDALLARVTDELTGRVAGAGLVSRHRQAEALRDAHAALGTADHTMPPEILAELVRNVSARLAEVVGRVAPDDYLDEVFSSFCIGK